MTYNQLSIQSHQGWTHFYWSFGTYNKCVNKLQQFIKKYPSVCHSSHIDERTIWINSVIDSGKKYYNLEITISNDQLTKIIKL